MAVYFIQNRETKRIKVGHSGPARQSRYDAIRSANARMRDLQTGNDCELVLLGVIPGGSHLESELQSQLEPYRVRGEWFSPAVEPKVLALLNGGQLHEWESVLWEEQKQMSAAHRAVLLAQVTEIARVTKLAATGTADDLCAELEQRGYQADRSAPRHELLTLLASSYVGGGR